MTPPGTRALRFARRWFGRAAADRVFEPLIADWQHEAADAPSDRARVAAHVRGGLTFAASGLLVVVRGAEPATRHARRAASRVMLGLLVMGLLQGLLRAFTGASTTAAWAIAVASALSVLPAFAVGVSRRQRRFARAWQPLLAVTVFTLLAQMAVLTLTWPWILSARDTATSWHLAWQVYLLVASVLPGVLGVAMARVCSRRAAAPELFGFMGAFPMWAWGDFYSALPPGAAAVFAAFMTVWARNVINEDHRGRAQHQARVARYRRLAARPTGR